MSLKSRNLFRQSLKQLLQQLNTGMRRLSILHTCGIPGSKSHCGLRGLRAAVIKLRLSYPARLKVLLIPTTNHLESFNAVLKRKYIPRWQRSGNRLRFDIFINYLVLKILPEIFSQRRMKAHYEAWVRKRFKTVDNSTPEAANIQHKANPSEILAWFAEDDSRELKAKQLLATTPSRLRLISPGSRPYEIWATCASSDEDIHNPLHLRYWLTMHPTGSATCTCADWLKNGGACKHLRALRSLVLDAMQSGQPKFKLPFPQYIFPKSCLEAKEILQQNMAWYGAHFEVSVTTHACAVAIGCLSGTVTISNGLDA